MLKSDINILIIDDDDTMGKSIEAGLNRFGYKSKWVANADASRSLLRHTHFDAIIIDCMLPVISGVDFSLELKRNYGDSFKLILTSGIFRDKHFMKEAQRKTGAIEFLTKPFDIEELNQVLEQSFKSQIDQPKPPLQNALFNSELSNEMRISTVQVTETVHGFELPQVYALLSRAGASGHLNLVYSDGEVSSIGFQRGEIDQVNVKDSNSFFGALLVENGFCSAEEVNESLALDSNKRLGERMVFTNTLSPHAIAIIHQEQMGIRLSKTIRDSLVQIKFISSDQDHGETRISKTKIQSMLHDWVATKISDDWLKTTYFPWLDHPVIVGPCFKEVRELLNLELLSQVENFIDKFSEDLTLRDLLDKSLNEDESELLKAIHFLILNESLRLSIKQKGSQNFEAQLLRLSKMRDEMKEQNHFQVLGLSKEASGKMIQKAYHDLAKNLHPDKLPGDAPADFREIVREIFTLLTESYNVVSNPESRRQYTNELEFGTAETALESENLFEAGQIQLERREYTKALINFNKALSLNKQRTEIHAYIAWTKLAQRKSNSPVSNELINEVQKRLNKVPPEERHSLPYFFTKGLYYKAKNNPEKALNQFQNVLAIDPHYIQAKKEISHAKKWIAYKESMEGGAVTSIVQGFFGIKKKKTG